MARFRRWHQGRLWSELKQNVTGNRISLLLRLAITIIGLQFIAVLSVVLFTYFTSEQALLRQSRDLLNKDGTNVVERIKGFMDPARQTISLAQRLSENNVLSLDDVDGLESFLFRQLQTGRQLSGIYFGGVDGRFVYVMRSKETGSYRTKVIESQTENSPAKYIWRNNRYSVTRAEEDPTDTFDPRTRPWFQDAVELKTGVWTDPYVFYSSQQPGITFSAPVYDTKGELMGVFGVDMEIDALSVFLSEIWPNKQGAAMIINRQGEVLAYPEFRFITHFDPAAEPTFANITDLKDPLCQAAFSQIDASEPELITEIRNSDFEFEGRRYVSTLIPVQGWDLPWIVAIFAPEENF
ncbi:MAG: cache domain-containing protein, partial [Pseudomonadota bacterium]